MPIPAVCACGKKYQVDDSLAGKLVKCKACGNGFTIPQKQLTAAASADDDEFRLAPLETSAALAAPASFSAAPAAGLAAAPAGALQKAALAPQVAPNPAAPASTAPLPSGLPFFLAVSQGWSKSMVYRVYVDRDALLLLDVGPYNVMVDLEVARKADGSNWMVKTVQALQAWVLGIAGVTISVVGMLGLVLARFGLQRPNDALTLASFIVTFAAFVIPVLLFVGTWSMRVLICRSQQLDKLFLDEIRQEAEKGGDKYRLRPGELTDVRIVPTSSEPALKHLAEATFKHPSGSWRLLIFARQDVQLACSTLRRFLGGAVQINPALERI